MTDAHCHVTGGDPSVREFLIGRDFIGVHPWETLRNDRVIECSNLKFKRKQKMAFKKSNSSAGEEFAARKRPPLRSNDQIDVNDIETLKYYITDYGKILPARITGVTSAQQRQIRQGVKRARNMGLMA